jgi:histidyl-tRNA synthetase
MSKVQAALPKGMRDFGPQEVARRNYIVQQILEVFERFGYRPLETPAMEKLDTLTGKYGEEGEKLLFKVLNNGDFLKKADPDALAEKDSAKLAASIAGKGMRYDLTIPFARYVVMNQNALNFPFRRYQIQPVWRADRPQKGRYREFVQCDVDVIGSKGLILEAELVQIYQQAFEKLGLKVDIRLNHRSILEGLATYMGVSGKFQQLMVSMDKLDKIGFEGVKNELAENGFGQEALNKLGAFIANGSPSVAQLAEQLDNPAGAAGISDLKKVLSLTQSNYNQRVQFDLTLARGLDYYTGTIFEVTANEAQMGSIGGGGRYDDLTGVFGLPGMSGVGISFGLDRIYDVMDELDLFPDAITAGSQVLFVNFGGASETKAFQYLTRLRKDGFQAEMYPEDAKIKKQMKYANGNGIPYVIFLGQEEMEQDKMMLKNMATGDQELVDFDRLKAKLSS